MWVFISMYAFRAALLISWLAVVYVTLTALGSESLAVAIDVYSNDLDAGNWRTQYCADLLVHLGLVGLWAAWRVKFSIQGVVIGLCCFLGGSLFSAAYLFALTTYHKGDMSRVVMGKRYSELSTEN